MELRADGFYFCHGDRCVGPYRPGDEIDEIDVAARLSGLGPEDVEEWRRDPGVNREKWTVLPVDVLAAKIRIRDYLASGPPPARPDEEGRIHTQVSRLAAELAGKPVVLNGQIVSEQSQKALPEKLLIRCLRCDASARVDLAKREYRDLLEAVVFKQRDHLRVKARDVLIQETGRGCIKEHGHSVEWSEEGFIDYAVLGVRDLLEEVEKFDQQVYRARRVHLIGMKVPASKKVRFQGQVVVDPATRDLCVLADGAEPLEAQPLHLQISDEDRKAWPLCFSGDRDLTAQVAPGMVGRELVQRAFLLILHSVAEIPDVHGQRIRGSLRGLEFGDTKTYKSTGARDLTIDHYGLGGHVLAETGSRTGIVYSIDSENQAIIWGELPLNDLGLVVIDGLHTVYAEEMKELRETLEFQRVTVRRFVSGEALARTRVIGIFNPEKSMSQYMYPCMAVKDSVAFREGPDVTRWDIFLPFGSRDVPVEKVMRREPGMRPIPEDLFKRHVYWAWSRRPEHIRYSPEARDLILSSSISLTEGYALDPLPIVHMGVRDVLCRLSVATAALDHSTDETHTLVIVDADHVERALEFYREMLDRLALGAYRIKEEGLVEISPSEAEEIIRDLGETEMEILRSIEVHAKSSTILAAELDLSDETIKRHYKPLKKHGLIATTPKVGVELTARGVQFLKAFTPGISVSATKNVANTLIPSVGDKLKIVYDKARELAVDGVVSKIDVADALEGQIDRREVLRLLAKLVEEGRLIERGRERYLVA